MLHFSVLGMLKYSIGWRPQKDPIEKRSDWEKIRLRKDSIENRSNWEEIWLRWDVIYASVCWSLLIVKLESGFFSENMIAPVMAEAWPAKESREASEAWQASSICPSLPFSALLLLHPAWEGPPRSCSLQLSNCTRGHNGSIVATWPAPSHWKVR